MGNKHITIHEAAKQGDSETILFKLSEGIDVDLADEDNWTALHHACLRGKEAVVDALLENNANVNAVENVESYHSLTIQTQRKTPLHFASYCGNARIVRKLIEKGAEINAADKYQKTPLHISCSESNDDSVIELLLEKGANVNALDEKNQTALHILAMHSRSTTVKLLVKNGAQVEDEDKLGRSVLQKMLCYDVSPMAMDIVLQSARVVCNLPQPDPNVVFPPDYNIGNYIVEHEMVRGGQSRILQCKSRITNERVILKLFPINNDVKQRYIEEYAAVRSICHRNVIALLAKFEHNSRMGNYFCIVLPYYAGGDLHTMIQSCRNGNRAVPCAEALQYAYYIASGLKAVHDKQIVHRDIKPSNILLGNEPKMLVISDFGYSKPSNAPPSVVGSQNYRSPEMISGTHTSATDVWSYGCLLYEMLTQKTVDLAFDLVRAENKEAKLQELRNDILTQDLYGTEFADLVVSTLNLKPEERPTIDEIMKLPLFSGIEPDHEHANEECVICLANPRSHACVPCGHKVLCGEDCVAMVMQMGRCPICRTPVTHCMRIYE